VQAGYEIFYLDESIFPLKPYLTRGWYCIGSRPTQKYVQTPYLKTCAFGALGFGEVMTKLSPKANGKKYLAFIKRLHKHHPKLCIIVDNARWHLTNDVMSFVKENDMKLIRLPPYSPELNPIEQYWKNVKNWLATRTWSTLPELKCQLRIAFTRRFLLPERYRY